MNRYRRLIVIAVVSLVVCLLCALLVDVYVELPGLSLETLASVTTIITSIIVFAAGIALYERFNGSQILIDKQTEKIIEFLTFLGTLNFSVEIQRSERRIFNLHVTDYKKRRDNFIDGDIDARNDKNVFNYKFFGMAQRLEEYSRDPYMPKRTAEKIQESINFSIIGSLLPPKENLFIVSVQGQFDATPPEMIGANGAAAPDYASLYETVNNESFLLEDIMYKLENMYNSSLKWLSQNNPTVMSTLNIKSIEGFDIKKDIY